MVSLQIILVHDLKSAIVSSENDEWNNRNNNQHFHVSLSRSRIRIVDALKLEGKA